MVMLETIAALALVYALLSVVASAFKELLEAAVQRRKRDLKGALEDLLTAKGARQLLGQGQVEAMLNSRENADLEDHRNWPSYIEPATFARVVAQMHRQGVLGNCRLSRALQDCAAGTEEAVRRIEQVYAQRMDRLGGSFKRNAQWWLLGIGMVCAVAMDADTVRLAGDLGHDSARRTMLTAMAQEAPTLDSLRDQCGEQQKVGAAELKPYQLMDCIDSSLPGVLGWSQAEQTRLADLHDGKAQGSFAVALLWKLVGYLLTAVAVSMGAPFWFDVLNKVSNLRATIKPLMGNLGGGRPEAEAPKAAAADPAPAPAPASSPAAAPPGSP